MSKNVVRDCDRTTGFTETLNFVDDSVLRSQHKSGSARIQSGLQTMFEKARSEGFAAGHEEGLELGTAEGRRIGQTEFEQAHEHELEVFKAALESFVETSQSAVATWYKQAEETLTALAIEIARRAICKELETSRESVLEITRNALGEVRHGTEVRVRVNPFDSSILDSRKKQVMAAVSEIRGLEVVSDVNVLTGCEIETDGGVVDGRIESFLARLAKEAA